MRNDDNPTFRLLLPLLGLLVGLLLLSQGERVQAQEQNYLSNPSFEGGYVTFDPNPEIPDCPRGVCTTAQMAPGWWPWWVSQTAGDEDWKNRMPEYKPAEAPFANRVRSGSRAQQYFTFHSTHVAGIYQRATVPANAQVRFSIWGHAWSDAEDSGRSVYPSPVNMRIGIDPTGGTNPFSPNIVWSGTANVYDNYALFSVDAQAQGDHVTAFTYSAPTEPRKHNDIYWDDAALVVIGQGAPPPAPAPPTEGDGGGGGGGSESGSAPPPAGAPPAQLGPTPTPNAAGEIAIIVQSGDTLWSIAARNGLTLEEILEMNSLTADDFIHEGDTLIVGHAEPGGEVEEVAEPPEEDVTNAEPGESEEATGEQAEVENASEAEAAEPEAEGAEGEAEAVALAEAAPQEETAAEEAPQVEEPTALCLKAYNDTNENGEHDGGEMLREAVAFTIANDEQVVSNYITDGVSEPFCIELGAGEYRVTRSHLPNERLTTPGDWAVQLVDGQPLNLSFGSVEDASLVASASNDPATGLNAGDSTDRVVETGTEAQARTGTIAGDDGGGVSGIVIAVVVGAVLLLIGVLVMILSARRAAA